MPCLRNHVKVLQLVGGNAKLLVLPCGIQLLIALSKNIGSKVSFVQSQLEWNTSLSDERLSRPPNRQEGDEWAGLIVAVYESVQLVVIVRVVVRVHRVAPVIGGILVRRSIAHFPLLPWVCYFAILPVPGLRAAAPCVIGFSPVLPFFAPLFMFISSGAGGVPRDVRAATTTGVLRPFPSHAFIMVNRDRRKSYLSCQCGLPVNGCNLIPAGRTSRVARR